MTSSDRHDRDKLIRWWCEIGSEDFCPIPINGIFLVTEVHKEAHSLFRCFRDLLKELDAPFSSLVIFGQHGSSRTMRALAKGLGLPLTSLPFLVLFRRYNERRVAGFPLSGIGGGFNSLEQGIHDLVARSVCLPDLLLKCPGASTITLSESCMFDTVARVVSQTSGESVM